ncbi:MAG: ATP-binding protein [Maledivibacter sp.]|jgi:signal transduction histidine kinase|nr:ATP-binding protein [Maledivibacter sp.]
MKFGIRTKLFISFTIVIVLPLIITGILLYFVTIQLENDPRSRELEKIKLGRHEIVDIIEDNYSLISRSEKLYKIIKPLLEKYDLNLELQDLDGYILFDSKDFSKTLDDKSEYEGKNIDKGIKAKTVLNIFHDNQMISRAIFYQYKNSESIEDKAKFYRMFTYGFGVMFVTVLITIFTWYMSGTILKPLKELSAATKNISEGNLDYQIKYKNNDEIGKFCIVFDDMRKELKESLENQVKYEKSRRELIASISHELRTPITSITGYVEGLEEGIASDGEMFQRYISVIKDKTEKLDHLIEDLFQYSQMELGQLNMNIMTINSMELFEEIFTNLKMEFMNTNIAFTRQGPLPDVEINVDHYRIRQVIDNLIQNAKRYANSDGKISAGVKLKNDNKIVVFITDNGEGIPEEDIENIFEKFFRGEKSRSREYGGVGLGLAICKHIVEAHGGEIWVDSKTGRGSTFYFTIPTL